VLMCAHHHRLLHRSGWEVRIATDGLPEFLPPVFLDKRRKPRRNNLHQPLPFAA
jgi:membrane glycosyltransferase